MRGAAVEEDPALGGDAPRRAVVDLDADGGRHLVRCHRASQGRTGWSARDSEKAVKKVKPGRVIAAAVKSTGPLHCPLPWR